MRYLIIGNGWIGNILKEYLGDKAFLHASKVTDMVFPRLTEFDVVINCAGKTNIDWCEKNKFECTESNVSLPVALSLACVEQGKYFVHFSSACVFESKNAKDIKDENSQPNPQCFYAQSKAFAEELIMESNPNALIVRIRLPISEVPHPRNTLDKIKNYSLLNDNQETVTVVEDMLPVFTALMLNRAKGIYHLVNKGTISPAQMGKELGSKFKVCKKAAMDKQMKKEGRAKRVTTYVTSTKAPLLPDIKKRIKSVIKKYKA